MHDSKFHLIVSVKVKVMGPRKFVKYGPMPDRCAPTGLTEANGGFYIMSHWDPLQSVTEP